MDVKLVDALDLSRGVELQRRPCVQTFVGRIARVRAYGVHRLLLLHETCREGRALAVWVANAALQAAASQAWLPLLDDCPDAPTAVLFRGRFVRHVHAPRLTADVVDAHDIFVFRLDCAAVAQAAQSIGGASLSLRPTSSADRRRRPRDSAADRHGTSASL